MQAQAVERSIPMVERRTPDCRPARCLESQQGLWPRAVLKDFGDEHPAGGPFGAGRGGLTTAIEFVCLTAGVGMLAKLLADFRQQLAGGRHPGTEFQAGLEGLNGAIVLPQPCERHS